MSYAVDRSAVPLAQKMMIFEKFLSTATVTYFYLLQDIEQGIIPKNLLP